MAFVSSMQPRDTTAACHSLTTLSMVAGGVTLIFAVGQLLTALQATNGRPAGATTVDVGLTVLAGALIMISGWSMRRRSSAHPLTWAIWPFAATSLIVLLDLLTADASTAAQIFMVFPALYAASQLRRAGVILVVTMVVAAEWAVTCTILPLDVAPVDASYMTAAIITTAALLTAAGERQEELVTLLERQAAIDPLTGLVTRRVLDDAAQAAMSGAAHEGGTALILIDIDHFKAINDTFGHPGGDEVLKQLAEVLVTCSRSTDVVSRMGGDEIAVLLPGCSGAVLAVRAERVLTKIRVHRFVLGDGRFVTVSISGGIAHAPTDANNLQSLYAAADSALYRAKNLGRDQIYSASVDAGSADRGTRGVTDEDDRELAVRHRLDDGRVA